MEPLDVAWALPPGQPAGQNLECDAAAAACGLLARARADCAARLAAGSGNVLATLAALCTVRVPGPAAGGSGGFRRLPWLIVALALLWTALCSMPGPQPLGDASAATIEPLAAEPSAAGEDVLPFAAALLLLLAVLLMQAPRSAARLHTRGRRGSTVAATAVLAMGMLLQLAATPAEANVCSAVKPICMAGSPPRPSDWLPASAPAPVAAPQPSMRMSPSPLPSGPVAPAPTELTSRSSTDTLLAAMGARKEAMHIPSVPPGYGGEVPQRVVPISPQPRLPRSEEERMFTQLLIALMTPPKANDSTPRPSPSPFPPPRPTPSPLPPSPPQGPSGAAVPDENGMLWLNNARLRVGIDTKRGGAITHLSSGIMPQAWAGRNLVNTWDSGRLVQQSYYGCEDGTCWSSRPWRWNPVQGGSWQNAPPRLITMSSFGGLVSTSTLPRNWGGQGLLNDVVMTTQTRLLPNLVHLRMTMTYSGNASHPPRHQEVPAVFVDRRLNVLATYTGNNSWTGAPLSFVLPGGTGEYYRPTERWAAYVDQVSGFGVGVYTPISDMIVAYRVGGEGSKALSDCSYVAPLITASVLPGSELSYDTYLAVGRVDEMRSWFAALAAGKQPVSVSSAQRRIPMTTSGAGSSASAAVVASAYVPPPPSSTQLEPPRSVEGASTAVPAGASTAVPAGGVPGGRRLPAQPVPPPPSVALDPGTFVRVPRAVHVVALDTGRALSQGLTAAADLVARKVSAIPELLPPIFITPSSWVPRLAMG